VLSTSFLTVMGISMAWFVEDLSKARHVSYAFLCAISASLLCSAHYMMDPLDYTMRLLMILGGSVAFQAAVYDQVSTLLVLSHLAGTPIHLTLEFLRADTLAFYPMLEDVDSDARIALFALTTAMLLEFAIILIWGSSRGSSKVAAVGPSSLPVVDDGFDMRYLHSKKLMKGSDNQAGPEPAQPGGGFVSLVPTMVGHHLAAHSAAHLVNADVENRVTPYHREVGSDAACGDDADTSSNSSLDFSISDGSAPELEDVGVPTGGSHNCQDAAVQTHPCRVLSKKPPKPPSNSLDFDGCWVLIDPQHSRVGQWLCYLEVAGNDVIDGCGKACRLQRKPTGTTFLIGGLLTLSNGLLYRTGRGGTVATYARHTEDDDDDDGSDAHCGDVQSARVDSCDFSTLCDFGSSTASSSQS